MGVFTGTSTDLGKLLLYIAMEQPERDAQLLTQHVNNFDIIVEVRILNDSVLISASRYPNLCYLLFCLYVRLLQRAAIAS
jgi:hypothetical protein